MGKYFFFSISCLIIFSFQPKLQVLKCFLIVVHNLKKKLLSCCVFFCCGFALCGFALDLIFDCVLFRNLSHDTAPQCRRWPRVVVPQPCSVGAVHLRATGSAGVCHSDSRVSRMENLQIGGNNYAAKMSKINYMELQGSVKFNLI